MKILEPTGEVQPPAKKYPWRQWLIVDGKPRVLAKDEDFTVDTYKMRIYLMNVCKDRGIDVTTKIVEGTYVVFQTYRKPDEPPTLPDFKPKPKRKRGSLK